MSTYLLRLQRAIAQTFKPCPYGVPDAYFLGWDEAGMDLEYSLNLSESACREHILHWLSQPDTVIEADKGYYDRILEINNLMEKM